uniref:Ig-like domain-containing protein n=1 Tax=Taeniopygia guttata TaxID=59729 RepID=A0A674GDZ5_TAEGU
MMNICLVANSRSFSPHAISLLSLPGVDTQSVPVQTPEMQARMKGTSARMSCQLEGNHIVHWYRQLPGEPPKRILYGSAGTPVFEDSNDRNRFQVRSDPARSMHSIDINSLTPRDSGTYYCALFTVMGYYSKVFGSGTKLIVSGKFSPPANSEILQKKHEDQIVYVCLIEKFYPEVIRVTWIKDGEEVTDNVVKGDTWQSTEEDEYSIASWLTVPAESEDKKYYCKYEHEEENILLETQVSETVLPLIAYRSKSL